MFQHGKFRSTGEKGPKPAPAEKSMDKTKEMVHGKAQQPHGGGDTVEHITKTHPGTTEPHPVTGVHAFEAHHVGGGKYTSHTHHDGGEVETRHHEGAADMHSAMHEALPDEGAHETGMDNEGMDNGFADSLGGIGGNAPSQAGG